MQFPATKGQPIASVPDLILRRLAPGDAPAYRALRLRGLRDHPAAFTSSHEEDCMKPLAATERRLAVDSHDAVWGAFAGDVLIGVVGLGREPRMKVRHKGVVFGMYVAPEHCGRGVGTALLRHLIAEARRDRALEQLTLTVTDGNDGARALYERAGFATFGVEPRAVRIGDAYRDKIHMIRVLAEP
jgi:RimJ/RimL family protein N-acetyltransferase